MPHINNLYVSFNYFVVKNTNNCHWILVVLWAGEIYMLNALPRSTPFHELEKSLSRYFIYFVSNYFNC